MSSGYADLDLLILRCRDERAKSYIVEAVSCYRSGAYKSSIVATYVAVCYDLIDKFRELSLAGDAAAQELMRKIEAARRTNDLRASLQLEREYLNVARDSFELISPLEFIDLDRLREDRNRCAHPAILSEEDIFEPSAELARLHIRCAVSHLLEHPPAQGKAALERLVRDISSEYFPNNREKARIALAEGPLRKPRKALVRNIVIICMKNLLFAESDWKLNSRFRAAFGALRLMFVDTCNETISAQINRLFAQVDDEHMDRCLDFVTRIEDVWQYLSEALRQKIEAYVLTLPSDSFHLIEKALKFQPLRTQALRRCGRASFDDIDGQFWASTPREVLDRLLTLYAKADSYAEANKIGKALNFSADDFDHDNLLKLLDCARQNDQIRHSRELRPLLDEIRSRYLRDGKDIIEELEKNGLLGLID